MKQLLFLTMTAFIVSCTSEQNVGVQQEARDDLLDEVYSFTEELKVFDKTGKYFVKFSVGSDTEGLLELALAGTRFELGLILEDTDPFTSNSGFPLSEMLTEKSNSVSISAEEVFLPENALGYFLEVTFDPTTNSRVEWNYSYMYTAPKWWHWGKVDYVNTSNTDPDVQVRWDYKKCALCSWKTSNYVLLNSTTYTTEFHHSDRRLRAKVWSNWLNYRVYFKHWGADPWNGPYSSD